MLFLEDLFLFQQTLNVSLQLVDFLFVTSDPLAEFVQIHTQGLDPREVLVTALMINQLLERSPRKSTYGTRNVY
jgi:hypothetical protein